MLNFYLWTLETSPHQWLSCTKKNQKNFILGHPTAQCTTNIHKYTNILYYTVLYNTIHNTKQPAQATAANSQHCRAHFTIHKTQYIIYNTLYTIHNIQYNTLHSSQCTQQSSLLRAHFTLHLFCILIIAHSIVHEQTEHTAVHCTMYIIYCGSVIIHYTFHMVHCGSGHTAHTLQNLQQQKLPLLQFVHTALNCRGFLVNTARCILNTSQFAAQRMHCPVLKKE